MWGITAIRQTCDRLRRPAAEIGSLARGNPYMSSRGIAPTTPLRASARGQHTTRYRAAYEVRRAASGLEFRYLHPCRENWEQFSPHLRTACAM